MQYLVVQVCQKWVGSSLPTKQAPSMPYGVLWFPATTMLSGRSCCCPPSKCLPLQNRRPPPTPPTPVACTYTAAAPYADGGSTCTSPTTGADCTAALTCTTGATGTPVATCGAPSGTHAVSGCTGAHKRVGIWLPTKWSSSMPPVCSGSRHHHALGTHLSVCHFVSTMLACSCCHCVGCGC